MTKPISNTRELDFGVLEAHIYPKKESSFTLYADDGRSNDYQNGAFTKTQITCRLENTLTLRLVSDNTLFPLQGFTAHIHMNRKPEKLFFNGNELYPCGRMTTLRHSTSSIYYFDEFNRMLHVKLPYLYPPAAIPCVILAVHYDRGGEAIAYHKNNPDTQRIYRDDNAGISVGEHGPYIRSLTSGEWLEYTVSCAREGQYEISLLGNTHHAAINISIAGITAPLTQGKARLSLGTGQLLVRLDVVKGSADIEQIQIDVVK